MSADRFFSAMSFRHPWRAYQSRVLAKFDEHVSDRRFHVVAAPGSGKTVLGLEVLRRLARPALVLAPTLVVRDQWCARLVEDFGASETLDPLRAGISTDPGAPAVLTASTYQSVAAAFKPDGGEALIRRLCDASVSVLVVDEAHHLRNTWWRHLDELVARLDDAIVVSLTATPPYDVSQTEWNRYASFCGPIDEEVGIPELVQTGDLCPHQDFVHLCRPTPDEEARIAEFGRHVRSFLVDLELDQAFAAALADHPIFREPAPEAADRLEHHDFHLAVALYLRRVNVRVPVALLADLGLSEVDLPGPDVDWYQELLQGLLFDLAEPFESRREWHARLSRLRKRLADIGAIERRRVTLRGGDGVERVLRHSITKLRTVAEIVQLECTRQRPSLRCVVLTDHIREEDFPSPSVQEPKPFAKLGVVSIFETLRRMSLPGVRLGILCGSLVVIPASAIPLLRKEMERLGNGSKLETSRLPHASAYVRVEIRERQIVNFVTALFELGEVNVLVGTASLLGEGWDAPCLDTLILASVIGSFVTSNQMRGRAIRVDPRAPSKIANIWHLACLRPDDTDADSPTRTAYQGGSDWETLERRFEAYAGLRVGEGDPVVESGIGRLALGTPPHPDRLDELNRRTRRRAGARDRTLERWRDATLSDGADRFRPIRELRVVSGRVTPRFAIRLLGDADRGLRAWLRRRLEIRRIRRIAATVLEALVSASILPRDVSIDHLLVREEAERCVVGLVDRPPSEQATLISAVAQVFDLSGAPRYLLEWDGRIYAVPAVLGDRKRRARGFSAVWGRRLGGHLLAYVHGDAGRRILLRAKRQALIDRFSHHVETRVHWRNARAHDGRHPCR